jgi:hypothetical protein
VYQAGNVSGYVLLLGVSMLPLSVRFGLVCLNGF